MFSPSEGTDSIEAPLCFSQEVLLALNVLRGQGGTSWSQSIPLGLNLLGPLDRGRLETALDRLVQRQAVLRTAFDRNPKLAPIEWQTGMRIFSTSGMLTPGLFRQFVTRDSKLHMQSTHITDATQGEHSALLGSVDSAFGTPFDLRTPPLMRVCLVPLGREQHLLFLTLHQLVCDSWSLRVIHQELLSAFQGVEANAPKLPFQFHDYATWQHHQATTGYFSRSVKYWRERWARFEEGCLGYSDLPFSATGEARLGASAEAETIGLSDDLAKCARERLGVPVWQLVLTAFYIFLHACTRKTNLALWNVFANRSQSGTENLVGYFAHLHLVGVEIAPSHSAGQLLLQVQRELAGGERHAEIHTSLLWRMLGRVPHAGDMGLLFNSVDETNPPGSDTSEGGLVIERAVLPHIPGFRAAAGLHVTVTKRNAGHTLSALYSPHHFRSDAIREMLVDIRNIAMEIAGDPECSVAAISERYRRS